MQRTEQSLYLGHHNSYELIRLCICDKHIQRKIIKYSQQTDKFVQTSNI